MGSEPIDITAKLRRREPTSWWNAVRRRHAFDSDTSQGHRSAINEASARFERFAPLIARLFPETIAAGGHIRSALIPVDRVAALLGLDRSAGRLFVKGDHDLPISGSVKARGGIHAVLTIAEEVAGAHELLGDESYASLTGPAARTVFAARHISVGSTGNLGLSVGTMASALGFSASVHMSLEAKEWKKRRLRDIGAKVIEHAGDYAQALATARTSAALDPTCFFIDDEDSRPLLYGYATGAQELADQLDEAGVRVDDEHPLIVHLPCGVGGAPAGIALGLHLIFGASVHCFFAEPVDSPCFTLEMMTEDGSHPSVYDAGLSGETEADGLAVPRASLLAAGIARAIIAGTFTVTDETMLRYLHLAAATEELQLEPSAAAGIGGPVMLRDTPQEQLRKADLAGRLDDATQVIWTTGGRLMPDEEHHALAERGRALRHALMTTGEHK